MNRSAIILLVGFAILTCFWGCEETTIKSTNLTFDAMRVDMPEATSYSGTFGITLELDEPLESIFAPVVLDSSRRARFIRPDRNAFDSAKVGVFRITDFPQLQWISDESEQKAAKAALKDLTHAEFKNQVDAERYLVLYRTPSGGMVFDFVDWIKPQPELFILEEYRLTSHLGDYGTGRIISTLSLLPGEATEYQVRNYSSESETSAASSSIFDSRTEESAESFQEAVLSEESSLDKSSKSFQASASVSASAGWGWGKAKTTASSKYGANSSREDFARNVSSAVNNHASKASASRNVAINNASTRESVSENEVFITKKIANPNLSRTLNCIFYQMNQEYITFLHLVDISVGVLDANGDVQIVPVYDLQSLLDRAVQVSAQNEVRERIESMLVNIRDYSGDTTNDLVKIERDTANPALTLYRVDPTYESVYSGVTGKKIRVPGIITSVNKIVLRTDGVYVDVLLGRNSALADGQNQAEAAKIWQIQHATSD